MSNTQETRQESYIKTKSERALRYEVILNAWEGSMTAREIMIKLGFKDMNSVRPRITELAKRGLLVEYGKAYDPYTDRYVTRWQKA